MCTESCSIWCNTLTVYAVRLTVLAVAHEYACLIVRGYKTAETKMTDHLKKMCGRYVVMYAKQLPRMESLTQTLRPWSRLLAPGLLRDATSESEEDEEERVEWGTRMYGVRMSPAHPRYVGRGDDTCGGEVVYTIPEIRTLLRSQPEDTKRWVTTSQMGWALTREENEVINEKDEREGKPVARQLAPMISQLIRAKWESEELEGVDDERRQILEEAAELDHIWGVWEVEKEPTNGPGRWIRQPSQSGDDMSKCMPRTEN
jgi:hypothetical protein